MYPMLMLPGKIGAPSPQSLIPPVPRVRHLGEDGRWYLYNDDLVREVSAEEVRRQKESTYVHLGPSAIQGTPHNPEVEIGSIGRK